MKEAFLVATQLVLLVSCASIDEVEELRTEISQLDAQVAARSNEVDERLASIDRRTTNAEGRLAQLENELDGIVIRTVVVDGDGDWHVAYANQSGSDLNLAVRLECAFLGASCQTSEVPSRSEIRILRILASTEDTLNFPVVENTVTVDTGPLELSSAGAVRSIVLPRGFQVIVRSQGPNSIRVRFEVR